MTGIFDRVGNAERFSCTTNSKLGVLILGCDVFDTGKVNGIGNDDKPAQTGFYGCI